MVLLQRTIEFLALPPGNLLLLLPLAFLLRQHQRLAISLITLSILQIIILSLPVVSNVLIGSLEHQYPVKDKLWEMENRPEAIVILGAGRNQNAPDYGGETTSLTGIERLRYAALLHRKTNLPILVSGGSPQAHKVSEAVLMQRILEQEFQVPVRWLETESHTTWQNAQYTHQILEKEGITSAWLITQAWHMPRSLNTFQHPTINYLPAPTSFGASIAWTDGILNWVPQATALQHSLIALHEYLGMWWYSFKSR